MLTVVMPYVPDSSSETLYNRFDSLPLIQCIYTVQNSLKGKKNPKCIPFVSHSLTSGTLFNRVFRTCKTKYLLLVQSPWIELGQNALERMIGIAEQTGAGMVYADYYEIENGERKEHPVQDYQLGSLRDGFDFGPIILFSKSAVKKSIKKYGALDRGDHSGLYDLRLTLSLDWKIFHIREFLVTRISDAAGSMGETPFAYVDPRYRERQKELEKTVTKYLKRIRAYLPPRFEKVPVSTTSFPVEASIIIPVKNRLSTIGDAVKSVLEQQTDFLFNCIVVDNYSTDGTTYLVKELAEIHRNVHLLIPQRTDLGIGGCWNEALSSEFCGRYAVQLDSDDLYSSPLLLQTIVNEFHRGRYAMVIGSYTLVDMDLKEIPPGIIDHREWTPANGRNNALRINGLGAPRAFDTARLRLAGGFPNVSYGEDYAAALRISRQYQIGRIYESMYLCRRWEGNTDSALPIQKANQYDTYKDTLRTIEILARQSFNRKKK